MGLTSISGYVISFQVFFKKRVAYVNGSAKKKREGGNPEDGVEKESEGAGNRGCRGGTGRGESTTLGPYSLEALQGPSKTVRVFLFFYLRFPPLLSYKPPWKHT